MSQIKETTLRFNLKREEDRKAWAYLQSRDPKQYKSYSRTAILAINDFFDRKAKLADDPYLETREKEDSLYYRVVVFIDPLQGLCYNAEDAVDWCVAPTA